ncbi:hypothetical protein NI456_06155 [Brevundimonas diminuta]|uniref:hypothetical protein n=1 Tax=Brevundimonas diminuta TaxID=293 RepID=UPI002096AAAE|nr:hypothetical protein [Brevundimonas diminuta]MCO8018440.1 hypothetical protein [Brevundimonas diminuta]MCO8020709.1 hypothetical protein [Brevundimonas diminuta]
MHLIDRLHAKSGPIRAFATSVMIGALVAAAPMMPLAIAAGIYSLSEIFQSPASAIVTLSLVAAPVLVAFPFVITASFIFGLPTFFILRKLDNETVEIYMIAGTLLGIALHILLLSIFGAETGHLLLGLTGAVSGSATAWSWARYRLISKGRSPINVLPQV